MVSPLYRVLVCDGSLRVADVALLPAQSFFSVMPDELIEVNLGDGSVLEVSQIDTLRSMIPGAFADMMSECATRCGVIGGKAKI